MRQTNSSSPIAEDTLGTQGPRGATTVKLRALITGQLTIDEGQSIATWRGEKALVSTWLPVAVPALPRGVAPLCHQASEPSALGLLPSQILFGVQPRIVMGLPEVPLTKSEPHAEGCGAWSWFLTQACLCWSLP